MSIFRFLLPGFKENWKVVLLSVFVAATFWFLNAMNKTYDTRIDYPIKYGFNRDSVIVISPLASTIKIDVSGGGWNLIRRTLKVTADPINIELENPTEIKFLTRSSLIPIVTDQLGGIDLSYIVTDTLYFDIEEKVTHKFPLVVDSISIPMRDNYRIVTPIELYTDSVTVVGPKSYVEQINKDIEIAFDDEEVDSDFERDCSYRINKMVNVYPPKTVVRFDVSRFLLKELMVPIEFLNFPEDSSVLAIQQDILLYYTVNEDFQNDVNTSDFSVTVDYNMMNKKDSTVAPLLMYAHEKAIDIVLNVDKIRLLSSGGS